MTHKETVRLAPALRARLVPRRRHHKIATGVVHEVPADLQKVLASSLAIKAVWEDITPLARNEWICWIESAKKLETRHIRLEKMCSKMASGMRRPCCWAGCPHR